MSDESGEKMKTIIRKMGFTEIGDKKTPKGDIYVGEREAWIGRKKSVQGVEVIYFVVSDKATIGRPANYSPKDGIIPSREQRLHEAFRHAEEFLNG